MGAGAASLPFGPGASYLRPPRRRAREARRRRVEVHCALARARQPARPSLLCPNTDTMFRFVTAGESHGRALVATVEGVPAGVPLSAEQIDAELRAARAGTAAAGACASRATGRRSSPGVRHGETLGSPIALLIRNRDWENWTEAMAAERPGSPPDDETARRVFLPRPGARRPGRGAEVRPHGCPRHPGAGECPGDGGARGGRRGGEARCSGSSASPSEPRGGARRDPRTVPEALPEELNAAGRRVAGTLPGSRCRRADDRCDRRGQARGRYARRVFEVVAAGFRPGSARTSPGTASSTGGWPAR
jgi:hypothetical protein